MKPFLEALKDGFVNITDITAPETLKRYREEGIKIDTEGLWVHTFGEHKEYDVVLEPLIEDEIYLLAIYKNGVLLFNKLPISPAKEL